MEGAAFTVEEAGKGRSAPKQSKGWMHIAACAVSDSPTV